jgi:hypothetical protein
MSSAKRSGGSKGSKRTSTPLAGRGDDLDTRLIRFAARCMWLARASMVGANVEPGTVNAGIAGIAVAAGLKDEEWGVLMREYEDYDRSLRAGARMVVEESNG